MKTAFLWSDQFIGYDFGPSHPLRPERLCRMRELLEAFAVQSHPDVWEVAAQPATRDEVLAVHTGDYYDAVAALSAGRPAAAGGYGFGGGDNPPFRGMLEASLRYTGASLQAARLVSAGQVQRAFNPSGGLHHAMANRASGFCVFNDAAVAIADLLTRHERVLYLDIDAHHGDGVQAAFYDSPRVLTISLHESGRFLFPGTGFPSEIGVGAGEGYSVNAPLHPGTTDETYARVFDALVPPLVRWFEPDVMVAQLGIDTHYRDPLTHLALTTGGFAGVVGSIRDWGYPLVALGGGGYQIEVVARGWTLALACLAEIDLPATPPRGWPAGIAPPLRDTGAGAPRFADRRASEEFADQTIAQVRRLVFDRHGIDTQ